MINLCVYCWLQLERKWFSYIVSFEMSSNIYNIYKFFLDCLSYGTNSTPKCRNWRLHKLTRLIHWPQIASYFNLCNFYIFLFIRIFILTWNITKMKILFNFININEYIVYFIDISQCMDHSIWNQIMSCTSTSPIFMNCSMSVELNRTNWLRLISHLYLS